MTEFEVPPPEYQAIEAAIHSDTSPVGIDAKKTHVIILHVLRDIQRRLEALEGRLSRLENPPT